MLPVLAMSAGVSAVSNPNAKYLYESAGSIRGTGQNPIKYNYNTTESICPRRYPWPVLYPLLGASVYRCLHLHLTAVQHCWHRSNGVCIYILQQYNTAVNTYVTLPVLFFFFFVPSLLLSSSTRRRFYPQRSSGQAVVTGVVSSTPRYVPSFLSGIGFSIPTARRFSSNVATSRSRAFC